MKSKILSILMVLLVTTMVLPASASSEVGADDKPLFSLTPWGGAAFWSDDIGLENSGIFGARAAVHLTRHLSFEGGMGWSSTEFSLDNSSADLRHDSLDLVIDFKPSSTVNPFILGGWSHLEIDDGTFGPSMKQKAYEAGAGLKWRLGGDNVNHRDLRLEIRDVMYDLVSGRPDFDEIEHNLIVSAGLQFHFGRGSKDADNDGVRDKSDTCDATPAGAVVDLAGCPVDSDGDGVYDGLDRCEGTRAGARVDAFGCPVDSDGDGVYDGLDKCAETPSGARVDALGCPSDADRDGVLDGLDECADTPDGAVIDARGCPIDSDGDGVFDGLDQCSDTPAKLFVDDQGCPMEITETVEQLLDTGMIRTSDVRFRSGSAELNTSDTAKLDEIGQTLSHWPELRIELSGHTDSQGSESLNQGLSEKRAQAVLDYLIAKFPMISAAQFTVVGYGESNPIADNAQFEGRTANRRVEFKVLNTDVIKRVHERRKLMERSQGR